MRIALALSLLLAACASDDAGTAPMISSLTYTPMTVTVGQATTISGSIAFDDTDGDLDQLAADVALPDGSHQMLPMTDLQNVGDMTHGTIAFAMTLVPPAAGAYAFSLWITDDGDHDSNHLDGSVTAQ